jgi:hypothetical protein
MLSRKVLLVISVVLAVHFPSVESVAADSNRSLTVESQVIVVDSKVPGYEDQAVVGVSLAAEFGQRPFEGAVAVEIVSSSGAVVARVEAVGNFRKGNSYVGGLLIGPCVKAVSGSHAQLAVGAPSKAAPLTRKPRVSFSVGTAESTYLTRVQVAGAKSKNDRSFVIRFFDRTRLGVGRGAIDVPVVKGEARGSNNLLFGDWSKEDYEVSEYQSMKIRCAP